MNQGTLVYRTCDKSDSDGPTAPIMSNLCKRNLAQRRGFEEYIVIVNNTNNNIGLVNRFNQKTIVAPERNPEVFKQRNCIIVEIWWKQTTNTTTDNDIDTVHRMCVTYQVEEFSKEPIYCPHCNMMLTLGRDDILARTNHKYFTSVDERYIDKIQEEIRDSFKRAPITVIGNLYRHGVSNKLYMNVNGIITKINISNNEYEQNFCKLAIDADYDNNELQMFDLDVETLISKGILDFTMPSGCIVSIGLDKKSLQKHIYTTQTSVNVTKQISEALEENNKKRDKELDEIKYESTKELNKQKQLYEEQIHKGKMENTRLLEELEGYRMRTKTKEELETAKIKAELTKTERAHKENLQKTKTAEATTSLWGTVAKTAATLAPIAAAVAFYVYKPASAVISGIAAVCSWFC